MTDEKKGFKRVTVQYERPNALFVKWLTNLYQTSVDKGSSKQYMYKKALTSLQKFPLPLYSGKECLILEYFGPELSQYLDWKLGKHKNQGDQENGVPKPTLVASSQNSQVQRSQTQASQKKTSSKGNPPKDKESKTAKSRRKGSEMYVPALRSGPYAFLVTLLSHESRSDFQGYLTKAEMLKEAQPLCDSSLTKPIPGTRYTAWSSMTSVVNKGLISRTGNPAKFSLTAEGREMALKLLKAYNSGAPITESPAQDDDYEMSQSTASKRLSPIKDDHIMPSQSSSRSVTQRKAPSKNKKVPENDLSPSLSEGSCADSYVPVSMQPGSFDVILLVDTSETTGNGNKTKAVLEAHRVNFEVRRLKVGDFSWIARDNISKKELLLPYIVERKRMDDLGGSIKDGRFHEQKFRLKQSGISNLIYLVENHGRNEHLGLPLASVQQAAVNTRVVDGFQVKYTNDHAHSMMYLAALTQTLKSIFRDKTLVSSRKSDLADKDLGPLADVAFLITYEEFNKASSKVRNFTIREMLIRQLLQLHGISVEKAVAIADLYPTPKALMEAFEAGGEDLLSNFTFGTNNRKLGQPVSKPLHRLYTSLNLS